MRSVLLALVLVLGCAPGCRLSDPVYATQEIQAVEPSREGDSLIFGTVVVSEWMSGDLSDITFKKIGPEKRERYYRTTRDNLFRAFRPRAMKDGHFVLELPPGVYELISFSTAALGQPRVFELSAELREKARVLITTPGVYDIGSFEVTRAPGVFQQSYEVTWKPEGSAERSEIMKRALRGTRWDSLPRFELARQSLNGPRPATR
jgi:hypothetical protein